jgi:hypothetical protein
LIEVFMSESMAKTGEIPNLWPGAFNVNVQTPYAILRIQANLLSQMTKAILVGEVETETGERMTQHRLVVVAPACNGYRHTLITVIHSTDLPYPAEVQAAPLVGVNERGAIVYPSASTDDEMRMLLAKALQSDETKALILSLIAKSNEAATPPAAQQPPKLPTSTSAKPPRPPK